MQIDLKDVRKEFDGSRALDGVSFRVPAGARVALVGPNGSGKSTLVRGVMGLVRCEGIRLDGLDPFTDRARLSARMAYVAQTAPSLGASVNEVVDAVAALRRLDPADIERVAGLLGLRVHEIARRPVRALSGGMKQKLLIALALAAPVSLFVLDEPTASLDSRAREIFFDLFEERAAGATLLLSSHRFDEVGRLADRVIALEDGRVTADEPVAGWLAQGEARAQALSRREVYA